MIDLKDFKETINTAKEALTNFSKTFRESFGRIFTKSFEYLYNHGIDLYNKKKYDKAITFFKLALKTDDVQPQVHYNLGLSYQCLQDYENAVESYKKFLELRPNDHDGLYNLALTYYTLEIYDKAIELFEKGVEINKDVDGVKALTLAYLSDNQAQKAIDLAHEILNRNEEGIDLIYAISKIFEGKNSINKDFTYIDVAIDLFQKLISIEPKHFKTYLSLSICYAKKGEWENSVHYCEKAIETNPTSFEANNQMGLVYYCCNEIEKSIKYYETALKLKPAGDYKIYSNIAYAYEKNGDVQKAIKIFTQLINKFPKYPARDEVKNHLRILKTLN